MAHDVRGAVHVSNALLRAAHEPVGVGGLGDDTKAGPLKGLGAVKRGVAHPERRRKVNGAIYELAKDLKEARDVVERPRAVHAQALGVEVHEGAGARGTRRVSLRVALLRTTTHGLDLVRKALAVRVLRAAARAHDDKGIGGHAERGADLGPRRSQPRLPAKRRVQRLGQRREDAAHGARVRDELKVPLHGRAVLAAKVLVHELAAKLADAQKNVKIAERDVLLVRQGVEVERLQRDGGDHAGRARVDKDVVEGDVEVHVVLEQELVQGRLVHVARGVPVGTPRHVLQPRVAVVLGLDPRLDALVHSRKAVQVPGREVLGGVWLCRVCQDNDIKVCGEESTDNDAHLGAVPTSLIGRVGTVYKHTMSSSTAFLYNHFL